jgi:hypothetical protein
MSLRRSYTDGPSESQKLYGSNLPPSLRWGAAKKHASAQSQEAIPKSELRARSHADPASSSQAYKKRERRHRATADNASEHSKELGTRERSRAPYAVKRAAEEKTERLLLEDTPNPREADSRPHTTRERAQGSDHVIEWLEESEARVTNDEEHADATADTEKYKTRKHHVTVDHLDEAPRSDLRDAAAAAGAEDSDFVQDGPRVLPEHQQREHEHPKNTRDRHTDKDHPGRADNPNNAPQFERPPVYAKIHLEYLSTQTLKYYDIPWEYAKVSHCAVLSSKNCTSTDKLTVTLRTTRDLSSFFKRRISGRPMSSLTTPDTYETASYYPLRKKGLNLSIYVSSKKNRR